MQNDDELTVHLTVGEVRALREFYLQGGVVGIDQEAQLVSAHRRLQDEVLGEVDRRIEIGRRLLISKGLIS